MNINSADDLSREVRVFISSTFRDMDGERNYLVKTTFPQLRKLCSERGIEFTELDLRWGVTEEEAKQGKVIKICLGEIDRCRPSVPFFIGILGERYGWIPSLEQLEKHKEILDDFEWVEKDLKEEMSITEMEIQYAVLRNPQMKGKAFFFLRGSENTPEEFMETKGSVAAGKLFRLKELLRKQNDFPVHDYFSNEELGKQVEGELWKVIEQHFPPVIDNDPLTWSRKEHATFARSRTTLYIGGEKYYQKLDEHFKSENQPIIIAGSGGMGKSALLANWLSHFREQHSGVFIFQHYIGGAPDSTDYAQVIKRMMEEMKTELELLDEIPSDTGKLKDALPIFFAKSSTNGKWILVLDALNQIDDRDNAKSLNWLPDFIPPYVRVYLSTTTGLTLEILQKRKWSTLNVEPLTFNDRRELISNYLKRYSKNLPIEALNRIASDKESENPLILRTLLDELRIFGKHEELDKLIEYYISTNSPEEFFDRVLERMETDYELDHARMVGEILSLIYCSRKGLSEKELLEITKIPPLYWSPLFIALENHLVSHGGLLNISHDFFKQAVESRYIPIAKKKKRIHQKIANYFILDKYGSHAFDELVYQLTYSEEWDEVIKMLTDFNYFMEKCKDNKLEGILDDYQLVFLYAPESVKNELKLWYSFFKERIHILRRGDKQWPSYKILFQLAMEHADESPITKQAEAYLVGGKVDWLWLFREKRIKEPFINSNIAVLEGHTSSVYGAIELNNGNILSWSFDRTLRLWDKDYNQLKKLEGHKSIVTGALILRSENILTWSEDKTLRIWDKDGEPLKVLEGHADSVTSAIELSNEYVLSWSLDISLIIWDKDGNPKKILNGHYDNIRGAEELSNGNLLTWSEDETLRIWDKEGNQISVLLGHTGGVLEAIELSNGNILSRCHLNLILWDLNGNLIRFLMGQFDEMIGAAELSDGNLISWYARGSIRIWDKEGNPMGIFSGHTGRVDKVKELSNGNILSWSYQGKTIIISDKDGDTLIKFDKLTYRLKDTLEISNGNLLFWSQYAAEETMKIWDIEKNSIRKLEGHFDTVNGASELSNGNLLSWSDDKTLRIWNHKGNSFLSLDSHMLRVEGVLLLNNGNLLSYSDDNTLKIWNKDGNSIKTLEGHNKWVTGALELSHGNLLSWSIDKTLRLWDNKGTVLKVLEGHLDNITDALELSNGFLLSWSQDGKFIFWDDEYNPMKIIEGHDAFISGAIELHSGYILSWSWNNTLRLWDNKGNSIRTFKGHTHMVRGAGELSNGYIVSWSNDIRIWDKGGECLEVLNFEGYSYTHPELWRFFFERNRKPYCDYFVMDDFPHSSGISPIKSNSLLLALWQADSKPTSRFLFKDGTIVLSTDGGQVCFLKIYDGKNRITLSELEEKIKSS